MRSATSLRFTARRMIVPGNVLTVLALCAQLGCTREFYREWANQDVSEAVFEKTRDPRWRMDVFSVEPPALSRYADPYDQDVPPAPPDDPASEALSPVPQWPDNRLLVPVEGTGYLDLLEYWKREQDRQNICQGSQADAQRARVLAATRPRPSPRHQSDPARHAGPAAHFALGPPVPPVPTDSGSPFANPPSPSQPSGGASGPAGNSPAQPGEPSRRQDLLALRRCHRRTPRQLVRRPRSIAAPSDRSSIRYSRASACRAATTRRQAAPKERIAAPIPLTTDAIPPPRQIPGRGLRFRRPYL